MPRNEVSTPTAASPMNTSASLRSATVRYSSASIAESWNVIDWVVVMTKMIP